MGKAQINNRHRGKGTFHGSSLNRNKSFCKVFGNVHEGQGYADKRKRKIINQYRKIRKHMLKEKKETPPIINIPETDNKEIEEIGKKSLQLKQQSKVEKQIKEKNVTKATTGKHIGDKAKRKVTRYSKVEKEFEQQKQMKAKQAQEAQKIREEKKAAFETYKSKKRARHKKLSQKSKKGQPIMKYHVEHLLKKIKSDKL
ncbi:uncharacterized protein [Antedon mediterranea]|uniref:uncharacterized protein n=1 Tax=Antedon mediterranea TaxID=105859 RepID=UPI003AF80BD9